MKLLRWWKDRKPPPARALKVNEFVQQVRASGRTMLNEFEAKQLLAHYGIPVVETRVAENEEQAVACASEIGYPVVLKLLSNTIAHKTDVDGVHLRLQTAEQVRNAFRAIQASVTEKAGAEHFAGVTVQPMVKRDGYELILGSTIDAQFGPVILFGSGGVMVEVYRDRALALPPLNTTLAQRLMEQTKIYSALQGVRGRKPVNLTALESLLVRFSQLVMEQPWIKEIDINPLLATPEQLLALDARVVVHDSTVQAAQLPRPTIRPYPAQYVWEWKLKDGTAVTIRPIRPEDEPLMVQFHATLSERSVYLRYFCSLSLSTRVEHERLVRICFGSYDRGFALVADRKNPETGQHEVLGVGRFSAINRAEAEAAVLVSDRWQGRGLGTELLAGVARVAREEKFQKLSGEILRDNLATQAIFKKVGFRLTGWTIHRRFPLRCNFRSFPQKRNPSAVRKACGSTYRRPPCSGDRRGFDDFQLRLELQVGSQRARNQAEFFGALQQIQRTIAFVGGRDLKVGTHHNLREAVARINLAHGAAGFHLQIGKVELGGTRNRPQGCGVATSNGGEQKFLRCPAAFESAKFGGSREVNGVGCGIRFRQTGAARRPPCCNSICVLFTHDFYHSLGWVQHFVVRGGRSYSSYLVAEAR